MENFLNDVGLFPFWYDVGFIILLYKVTGFIKKIPCFKLLLLLIFVIFLYYIMPYWNDSLDEDALTTFRVYLHCFVLFSIFSTIHFKSKEKTIIINTFLISSLIYSISALFIYFIFQEQWHTILGHYVKTAYRIEYSSSSYTIMGYQRLFGFLPGPNQYGVYSAIAVLFLLYIDIKLKNIWVIIALFFSIISLFLSFSRAGYAIVIGTVIVKTILEHKLSILIKVFLLILLISIIGSFILLNIDPDSWNIISSTLTGKEDSSADRSSNVMRGLSLIQKNPWGVGLGTGILRNGTPVSESSLVICLYELGIISTIIIYLSLLFFSIKIYRKKQKHSKVICSFIIMSLIVSYASMNIFQYPFFYYLWAIIGLGLNVNNKLYIK